MKDYGFLSFAKNLSKNVSKDISKNLIVKYSQKSFDHAKQSATDALKTTSKRLILKETTGDYTSNKITKLLQNFNTE